MSQHALRGATWMAAAGLLVTGIGGLIRALSVGVLFLMPTAATAISATAALLVLAAKLAVAVLLLSRLAKDHPAKDPPWLVLILLIALGLTGVVFSFGSGWAQSYVLQRAVELGEYADYAMAQSIVAAASNVLNPLIDVGTLIAAAWLWQSRSRASEVSPGTAP